MKPPGHPQETDDEATGLRWLPAWRGVYLLVLAAFAACVILLTILTRVFS